MQDTGKENINTAIVVLTVVSVWAFMFFIGYTFYQHSKVGNCQFNCQEEFNILYPQGDRGCIEKIVQRNSSFQRGWCWEWVKRPEVEISGVRYLSERGWTLSQLAPICVGEYFLSRKACTRDCLDHCPSKMSWKYTIVAALIALGGIIFPCPGFGEERHTKITN